MQNMEKKVSPLFLVYSGGGGGVLRENVKSIITRVSTNEGRPHNSEDIYRTSKYN